MDQKVKVKIKNLGREIDAVVGCDLRTALMDNDVEVYDGKLPVVGNLVPFATWKNFNCQGHGLCGSCVVNVAAGDEGLSPQSIWEKIRAGMFQGMHPRLKEKPFGKPRLACLTRCYQDAEIETLQDVDAS